MVHDKLDPSNSMVPHTQPVIAMGSTGILQGSYEFLCLETGKKIIRQAWTKIPMPKSVIDIVNQMGKKELEVLGLTFMDGKKCIIEDEIDEDNFNLDVNTDITTYPSTTDFKDEIPGIEMEDSNNIKNKFFMPNSEKDIIDLAEASADNTDEGRINEDIPMNRQNIVETEAEIQDNNSTKSGNNLISNITKMYLQMKMNTKIQEKVMI